MISIISNNSEYILKMLIASICGLIVGYERNSKNKEAGIRTHAIVSLSACVMTIVSKYGFLESHADTSRLAAQIVSGVGFLGAGVIFVKDKITVSGLTTAAGLWGTAGIGISVGSGMYTLSIFASFLMVCINHYFKNPIFLSHKDMRILNLEIEISLNSEFQLDNFLRDNHFKLLSIDKKINQEVQQIRLKLYYVPEIFNPERLVDTLQAQSVEKFHFMVI